MMEKRRGSGKPYNLLMFPIMFILIFILLLYANFPFGNRFIDLIFLIFHILVILFDLYLIRISRIGYRSVLLLYLSISSMVPLWILYIMIDINNLSRQGGNGLPFDTGVFSIITVFSFGVVFTIFGMMAIILPRDSEFEEDRIILPLSIWDERIRGLSREASPYDLLEIYPRWISIQETTKLFKPPDLASHKLNGYGFKLINGDRYGFETASRVILKRDILNSIDERRFSELRRDHARFSRDEWDSLRDDLSHWWKNDDSVLVIGVLYNVVIMIILGTVMMNWNDPVFMPPAVILVLLFFSTPSFVILIKSMLPTRFRKGVVARMLENGEAVPSWLEVKAGQLMLVKES